MTREQLIDILKLDGTQQEIEEAIEQQELTQEARDRIYDFLRADNKQQAEERFELVLQDIENAPDYSSVWKEGFEWTKQRIQLAFDIRDINAKKLDYEQKIAELSDLREQALSIGMVEDHDIIKDKQTELNIKTYQYNALGLLQAQAKDMQKQVAAKAWTEMTKAFRTGLAHAWDGARDMVQNLIDAKKQVVEWYQDTEFHKNQERSKGAREFSAEFEKLAYKSEMKADIKNIKECYKTTNELKKDIDNLEKELIKAANKISYKQFKKDEKTNSMKAWARGEDAIPYQEIRTLEQATRVIENSHGWSAREVQKDLEFLRKQQSEFSEKAKDLMKQLERVRDAKLELQKNAKTLIVDYSQALENGEINLKDSKHIEQDFARIVQNAYVQDQEIADLIRGTGLEQEFSDVLNGPKDVNEFIRESHVDSSLIPDVSQSVDNNLNNPLTHPYAIPNPQGMSSDEYQEWRDEKIQEIEEEERQITEREVQSQETEPVIPDMDISDLVNNIPATPDQNVQDTMQDVGEQISFEDMGIDGFDSPDNLDNIDEQDYDFSQAN